VRRETRIAAAVFIAIPVVIVAAATVTTWAIAHGASRQWRLLFLVMCHGIPARCLTLWNVPMPICARCTAIYAGLFAGLVLFVVVRKGSERVYRWLTFAAAIPVFIDGVTQAIGLRESTNGLRLATGAIVGFAFGMWVLCAIENAPKSRPEPLDAV
jgi:uncharacterized membrane protein